MFWTPNVEKSTLGRIRADLFVPLKLRTQRPSMPLLVTDVHPVGRTLYPDPNPPYSTLTV